MTVDVFLDTNVIVYAASTLKLDAFKQSIAIELLATANHGTSTQVLQEFYHVCTRKIPRTLSHEEALNWIENFEDVPCALTDLSLVVEGAENAERFKISYWDGAIIAAAERLGAHTLYSEDLNHGQKYGSVTVINPFKAQ